MSDGIISCADIILKAVDMTSFSKADKISSVWRNILLKIHNYEDEEDNEKRMPIGERLAGNTRVVDYKKGVLLIETDHPGWIQYLKFHQKFILNGLKREIPDLDVKNLAFRIKGSDFKLNDNYDSQVIEAKKKFSEKLDNQDKELEKIYEKQNIEKEKSPSSNLPPELLEKFESIKRSMLTNDEK